METTKNSQIMLLVSLLIRTFITSSSVIAGDGNLQTYIVLLDKPEETNNFMEFKSKDLHKFYQSFLAESISSSGQSRLIHSYHHVATGFAAKLTPEEAKAMGMREEVILARPERMVRLHTTRTPRFLGLQQNLGFWKSSNYGKGVIVGVIDSGIAADHPSFSGKGMPPPPKKWKGKCELKGKLSCNNKLIGARNFATDSTDLSDEEKHGTHTASTIAGSPVQGASFFGQGNGTATGMAPLAHLAFYKVTGSSGKTGESEILAAMDTAIDDNVDVLSLSLGIGTHPFYDDVIAMAAYAAIQKGIFVSCSAGNEGPNPSTLSNEAPWILTVGASYLDREIRASVLLGNKAELSGQSLVQPENFPSTLLPLVYAGENGNTSSQFCLQGSLKNVDIKGKIVLCEGGPEANSQGQEVKKNGGAAMIQISDNDYPEFDILPLPGSQVSTIVGEAIKAYIKSSPFPKATILFKGTTIGLKDFPRVAVFSSRGPNTASPGILKPDIIGPGVRILAAWPIKVDNTNKRFFFESGTSMSCPVLSGIAALLKSAHPDWSPAAIKSAIMTTADLTNRGGQAITNQNNVAANVYEMGAGHVNPSKANNPGLVYDIQPEDYVPYLCGLGYSDKQVQMVIHRKVKCSNVGRISESQLNYPAFSIELGSTPKTYTRTVTNVGRSNSTYKVEIFAPSLVDITVNPRTLSFSAVKQKATYSVIFRKSVNASVTGGLQGYLAWVGPGYRVGSPIIVNFK